jgi:hypothetical protein
MLKRTRALVVAAALVAGNLYGSQALAWAQHDASIGLAPLSGTLTAHGKARTFYTATGGAANYSYYFSPSFALETGYEGQFIGTTPILHGPDIGITTILWGERSFSFSEDNLYLKVTQPLSISATVGSWYRFYALKNLFPESVRTLDEYEDFVKPGAALGVAASGNLRIQIFDTAAFFMRVRYVTASVPELQDGSFKAYSMQLGIISAL